MILCLIWHKSDEKKITLNDQQSIVAQYLIKRNGSMNIQNDNINEITNGGRIEIIDPTYKIYEVEG